MSPIATATEIGQRPTRSTVMRQRNKGDPSQKNSAVEINSFFVSTSAIRAAGQYNLGLHATIKGA